MRATSTGLHKLAGVVGTVYFWPIKRKEHNNMQLKQTFKNQQSGVMGGNGPHHDFYWGIDHEYADVSRVGSWDANWYFTVKTGYNKDGSISQKGTLGNARRSLARRAREAGEECTFEYID